MKLTHFPRCRAWLLVALSPAAGAADVDFMTAYQEANTGASVNIDLTGEDRLIFRSGTNVVLHGRRLVITAGEIALEGDVLIRQFDDSDVPPAPRDVGQPGADGQPGRRSSGRNGADGATGAIGGDGPGALAGRDAPSIVLDIGRIDGSGKLIVDNSGGQGGPGGQGGMGGTGGPGEKGADGSDRALNCHRSGANGGNGGPGGQGGTGGVGGKGGNGGWILVSSHIHASAQNGRLTLSVANGKGGNGGFPGAPGLGGGAGEMGRGSTHCGGGRWGNPGAEGPKGKEGPRGADGSEGTIQVIGT